MPLLLSTSSFKTAATVVIIAGVFSAAMAVSFTVPSVSHFVASCYPMIYDNTAFLLKPPYLYLVINCIIVSIVATSKLTHKSSSNIDVPDFSQADTPVTVVPVPSDIDTGYLNVSHHAVASDYTGNDPTVEDVPHKVILDHQQPETEKPKLKSDWSESEKPKPSSDWSEPETQKPNQQESESPEISRVKLSRKPPRYIQQKSLRMSAEEGGGDKKPLRRREDTLETTWKKITEGHSTPLAKHLTKSDTWQERSRVHSSKEEMTKSENLNDVNAPTELKREPSPGQEELNRRVEAFIKKFNEEMRLQRLESLAKKNEMLLMNNTGERDGTGTVANVDLLYKTT